MMYVFGFKSTPVFRGQDAKCAFFLNRENHKSPALLLRVIEQAAQEQIKKLNKIFSFQGPLRTEKKREDHGSLAYYKGSQVLF